MVLSYCTVDFRDLHVLWWVIVGAEEDLLAGSMVRYRNACLKKYFSSLLQYSIVQWVEKRTPCRFSCLTYNRTAVLYSRIFFGFVFSCRTVATTVVGVQYNNSTRYVRTTHAVDYYCTVRYRTVRYAVFYRTVRYAGFECTGTMIVPYSRVLELTLPPSSGGDIYSTVAYPSSYR